MENPNMVFDLFYIQIKYYRGMWFFYTKCSKIIKYMSIEYYKRLQFTDDMDATLIVFGDTIFLFDNLISIGKLPKYEQKRLTETIPAQFLNLVPVKCLEGIWLYRLPNKKVVSISNEKLYNIFIDFRTFTFKSISKLNQNE